MGLCLVMYHDVGRCVVILLSQKRLSALLIVLLRNPLFCDFSGGGGFGSARVFVKKYDNDF